MEGYQIIGFIGLDNPDGTMTFNVPLYVKIKELNKDGSTNQVKELLHKIAVFMRDHYESQLSEYIAKLKRQHAEESKKQLGNK